jgi:TPR repeat protein
MKQLVFWLVIPLMLSSAFAQTDVAELQTRAERGDASAQVSLGIAYESGRGIAKDEAAAVQWFRKAAEQGNAAGQMHLARMYQQGRGGLPRDDVQAASWYRKAAQQGDATAEMSLAVMYNEGRGGLAKDAAQAVYWTRKAAEQGDPQAEANLGLFYFHGLGGLPKDETQALRWWHKAADQGNAAGLDGAAWIYATSVNLQVRSPRAALEYALKAVASSRDHPEYLDTLAEAYYVNRQFQRAVDTELQAIALAPPGRKSEYEKNLAKYKRASEASTR